MAKPSVLLAALQWATNTLYGSGPDAGTNTKSEPAAGRKADGFRKLEKPPAQEWNWVWHYIASWVEFLYDDIISVVLTDLGVLKADTVDTTQIVDKAVTLPKLQEITAYTIIGKPTAGDGVPIEIQADVTDGVLMRDFTGSGAPLNKLLFDKIETKNMKGGGNHLVYGTSGAGVVELTQIETAQVADAAITQAKAAPEFARWEAGGSASTAGAISTSTAIARIGNVTYLSGAAFTGSHSDFEVRKAATGVYQVQFPTGEVMINYVFTVSSNHITAAAHLESIESLASASYWQLHFSDNAGVATDCAFNFSVLRVAL